jgi:hypothetical protein
MKSIRCALAVVAVAFGLASLGVGRAVDSEAERAQCCDGTLSPTCGCD